MAEDSSNALGLDFSQMTVEDKQETDASKNEDSSEPAQPATHAASPLNRKDKEKPYVNPERVNTGGSQRDKLTDEALQERMARIREQNEKIKQRRIDVQADEDAFRKTQEVERAKQAQNRRIQSDIDRARDQNAKRKMDKVQSREWDSGKPAVDRQRQGVNRSQPGLGPAPVQASGSDSQPQEPEPAPAAPAKAPTTSPPTTAAPEGNADSGGNWTRGAGPSHPRGRGRGRGAGGNRGRGNNRRESGSGKPPSTSEAPTTKDNPPSAST